MNSYKYDCGWNSSVWTIKFQKIIKGEDLILEDNKFYFDNSDASGSSDYGPLVYEEEPDLTPTITAFLSPTTTPSTSTTITITQTSTLSSTITPTKTLTSMPSTTLTSTPMITPIETITCNQNLPVLSNGSINPRNGYKETTFEYSVFYNDDAISLPHIKRLYINEEFKNMDLKSGNPWLVATILLFPGVN